MSQLWMSCHILHFTQGLCGSPSGQTTPSLLLNVYVSYVEFNFIAFQQKADLVQLAFFSEADRNLNCVLHKVREILFSWGVAFWPPKVPSCRDKVEQ